MLTRLKLLLFSCLFYSFYANAQSELRFAVLTTPLVKTNFGVQLEYAIPFANFFEITSSVLAIKNHSQYKYLPYGCFMGEPFLITKQRYAFRQRDSNGNLYAGMLGFAIKPFAKLINKHDIALGINVVYGYSKYNSTDKVETEDGTYQLTNNENYKGFGGTILCNLRYGYKVSNHSSIGMRYIVEAFFWDWKNAFCSVYYGYRF